MLRQGRLQPKAYLGTNVKHITGILLLQSKPVCYYATLSLLKIVKFKLKDKLKRCLACQARNEWHSDNLRTLPSCIIQQPYNYNKHLLTFEAPDRMKNKDRHFSFHLKHFWGNFKSKGIIQFAEMVTCFSSQRTDCEFYLFPFKVLH